MEQDGIGGNGIELARRLAAERADTVVPVGEGEGLKGVLTFDAGKVEAHLSGKVREAVEEVLNGLLDADADGRCGG
jgi:hypothetical protein